MTSFIRYQLSLSAIGYQPSGLTPASAEDAMAHSSESQRNSAAKPKVARHELPWVPALPPTTTPTGLRPFFSSSMPHVRITGQKFSAIPNPHRSVLAGEWPAFFGGSWHPYKESPYPDAPNNLAFVDGHAALTRIYWNRLAGSRPLAYEPPDSYDYSWSGQPHP